MDKCPACDRGTITVHGQCTHCGCFMSVGVRHPRRLIASPRTMFLEPTPNSLYDYIRTKEDKL